MVYIRAEVEVRPTEDLDKVLKALRNVLLVNDIRTVELSRGYKLLVAESSNISSLLKLYELIRRQRILDTARNYFLKYMTGNTVTIKLNKQAAFQGVVSFVDRDDESQLGVITITITSDRIDEIVDWLTPRTAHGKPLWERDIPKDA